MRETKGKQIYVIDNIGNRSDPELLNLKIHLFNKNYALIGRQLSVFVKNTFSSVFIVNVKCADADN